MLNSKKIIPIVSLIFLSACNSPIADHVNEKDSAAKESVDSGKVTSSQNTPSRVTEAHSSEPELEEEDDSSSAEEKELSFVRDDESCPLYFKNHELCATFSWNVESLDPNRDEDDRDEVFSLRFFDSETGEATSAPELIRVKFMMSCCGWTSEGQITELSESELEVTKLHFMPGTWRLRIQILDKEVDDETDDTHVIEEQQIEYVFS